MLLLAGWLGLWVLSGNVWLHECGERAEQPAGLNCRFGCPSHPSGGCCHAGVLLALQAVACGGQSGDVPLGAVRLGAPVWAPA